VTKLRAVYEIQVFRDTPKDRQALGAALMIFVRNTSHILRTQTNQIMYKFDHPENNPKCTMYYIGLRQDDEIVGFCMLGYFPRRRLVLVDHLVIDAEHRKHGAFYVFASLVRSFIEQHCPDFDYVVAEVATDREFAEDEVSGQSVVRVLRQVGFGEVRVKYSLANTEPDEYRRTYRGDLMIRSSQKILALRAEEFLAIYHVILFDHYLGWYKDFFGGLADKYEAHLTELHKAMQKQVGSKATIFVNGATEDQIDPPLRRKPTRPLGPVEHILLFLLLVGGLSGIAWFLTLSAPAILGWAVVMTFVFAAILAFTNRSAFQIALKLLDLIKSVLRKLV
jgi:hypothetical protein